LTPFDPFYRGWRLRGDADRQQVADLLKDTFATGGLPWLRERITDQGMRERWLSHLRDGDDFRVRAPSQWDEGCRLLILLRAEGRDAEASRLLTALRSYADGLPETQRPWAQERVGVLSA
jgi:hypothetical protein